LGRVKFFAARLDWGAQNKLSQKSSSPAKIIGNKMRNAARKIELHTRSEKLRLLKESIAQPYKISLIYIKKYVSLSL
jgi:hypothetical protein